MTEMTAETAPALDQLATALAAFQAEMPTVPKAHTATVKSDKGSYSYTYAGLADVTEAAMPLLSKHGLSFVTLPGQGVLTGILLHSSGQSLTATLPINGATPQQVGSSLTYMRRYLLGCMTGLVTDDDDDGQQAEAAPKATRKPAAPKQAPADKPMTDTTRGRMYALIGEFPDLKDNPDKQREGMSQIVGRPIESRASLTEAEALAVIGVLSSRPRPAKPAEGVPS